MGSRPIAGGHDGPARRSANPNSRAGQDPPPGGSPGGGGDRIGSEFARLTAKAIGRAREEAEDIWADAQELREDARPVLRRTATYGLAGLLRARDAIASRAREVGAEVSARTAPARSKDASASTDLPDSRDVMG